MSGSTPDAALADYERFKARQAGPADTASADPAPDPEAARQASERHAISLLTPAGRAAEAARVRAAVVSVPPPDPRESLRSAHAQREAAAAEAIRQRSALDRANEHLASATAARDAAKRDFANIEAEHTQKLVEELAAGSAGRVAPIAGEKRVALAEAEHQLGIAQRAADKLGADLATAQTRLTAAEARVEAAICQMLLAEAERQAVEILRGVEAVDQRRARLDALTMQVTALQRRQGAARSGWPTAVYTALQLERLRDAPRLPSQFSTPAGDAMVQQWSRVAAALDLDPEAEI